MKGKRERRDRRRGAGGEGEREGKAERCQVWRCIPIMHSGD
jgi:hypothetical protein